MDVRRLATPAVIADSGREDSLPPKQADEMARFVTERTSDVESLSGSAFCADAYYITDALALPPALPTPDEELVAMFSCLSTFVSAPPPSGFEDALTELTTVGGIRGDLDEGPSNLGRTDKADQRNERSEDNFHIADFPHKLRAAKDNSRPNSSEGETSNTVATFHPFGNSKQLVAEIRQFLHLNASSSRLHAATSDQPRAGSSWSSVVCQQPSSQTEYTTEEASFKQHVLDQQLSEPSTVESLQRSDASRRLEASQVSRVLSPLLSELPECSMPFEAEFYKPMIEGGGMRKPVDLQSETDFRKPILPEPESSEPMPRDRELKTPKPSNSVSQKPAFTEIDIPPESTVPAAFLETNFPAPEIAFIEAVQSQPQNETLLSSKETMRDTLTSVRKGLISEPRVQPMAKEKSTSDYEVSVSQDFPFARGPLTQIEIDGKASIQSPTAQSVMETNRETVGRSNNAIGSPKKLTSNYTIDLIPPPAEFITDEQTYTDASEPDDHSKGEQSPTQGATDKDLCRTKELLNSADKNTARTAVYASTMSDTSNGFKASNSRSLMRPKLPPPEPPSRLDNQEIGSSKGGVESGVTTAVRELVSRKARNNDTVDRISLCQYGRDTALAMLKAETVTIRVKASSTANLVEAVGLSPRFSVRPEPPRRSCSIPRKPSTHSLSEWVRVDPDGSSDDLQKQSPEARVSANSNNTSTTSLRNGSFLRSSTIKAFAGGSSSSERVKPTAQIRPNAIRSISSSVCIGAKYFPNVESLIQQYSQTDASATPTGEFKTAGKATNKYGSKSTGGTSKFGTLKGRLRDYVTASSTKKQTFSYAATSKTLSHAKDKNGSKLIKLNTGTWEPKPTDYQQDEGETLPESSNSTKPNYISSYLSFAGPKPYTPPRTVSSLVAKNEDQPNLSTFRTFIGSRIASCSSLASDKDSLAKFRTEANSQSLTGSPSSSGSPPDSKIDMINEWLESRSVDCNSPLCDSEDQSPTKLESFKTEYGPDEPFLRQKESNAVFTREPPSNMSSFRTSGSISVHSSVLPQENYLNKVTSPESSRRPVFPGVITSPGIANRPAIPCVNKITHHSKTLPRNVHGWSRNLSESEETTVRSPVSFNPSPLGGKVQKESDKGVEIRPNGMKELPAESAFENADCIVTDLVQKLRSTFSEETNRTDDVDASKERLIVLTRQFVADSQNLVSSATQNRDRLVQSVTTSSETLSRIVDNCLGTASAMGPKSQAVILNNRVMDLTGAYRATMIAARVAVGKPLSCPEMNALMKQATSLAAILSSLIKLLNRL